MKPKIFFSLFALSATALLSAQTLNDAIRMTDNEQFENAKTAFEKLIGTDPNNGDNYYYYGKSLLKNENTDAAKTMFEKGIQKAPTNPLNFVGLGNIQYQQKNTVDANKNFMNAKTIAAAKNPTVLTEIAEVYITSEVKNIPEAQNLLNQAFKLNPKSPEVSILIGDAYLEQGDGGKAVANYDKAAELDKKSVKAILRLGQLYSRAQNYQLAIDHYKKSLSVDSTFAPAYREMAELYFRFRQSDKAISNYKKYLALNNNLSARIRYSQFLYVSKDYTGSIAEITEILKKDSSEINLYRILGYDYVETGDCAKGILNIEKFLEKASGTTRKILPSDYEYLGKSQIKCGKDSLGIITLKKAVQQDSSKSDTYLDLGNAFLKQKKYPEAISAFEKRISMDSKGGSSADFFYLGKAQYLNKEYVKSDSSFSKVISLTPNYHVGYLWKARCKVQSDLDSKLGLAKPFYEMCIEKAIGDPVKNKKDLVEAYGYLGSYYYLVSKDNAKSKEYWDKIIELDPQNEQAAKMLKGIKVVK